MRFPAKELKRLVPGALISLIIIGTTAVLLLLSFDSNDPPSAVIGDIPATIDHGESVLLDGSNSTDPDGDELEYLWNITGGGYSGQGGLYSSERTFMFTFPEPGTYTVKLRVTDPRGKFDTETHIIEVR